MNNSTVAFFPCRPCGSLCNWRASDWWCWRTLHRVPCSGSLPTDFPDCRHLHFLFPDRNHRTRLSASPSLDHWQISSWIGRICDRIPSPGQSFKTHEGDQPRSKYYLRGWWYRHLGRIFRSAPATKPHLTFLGTCLAQYFQYKDVVALTRSYGWPSTQKYYRIDF